MEDKGDSFPVVMASSEPNAAASASIPNKATIDKSKKPRTTLTHPKTADMVNAAIKALNERGGSSVQAIKKYMVGTYIIDVQKQLTFIKRYLKSAVASGVLVQTKGKGAAGSFKLSSAKIEAAKPKTKSTTKAATPKKTTGTRKPVATNKPALTAATTVPTKNNDATADSEKSKKAPKGSAVKLPNAKTTKSKPAAKLLPKAKPTVTKKTQPAVAKPKKAAPQKTTASNN